MSRLSSVLRIHGNRERRDLCEFSTFIFFCFLNVLNRYEHLTNYREVLMELQRVELVLLLWYVFCVSKTFGTARVVIFFSS